tara:strand:- start:11673 stop:12125 length:453 start_codon:yes stop_codon:yes gene_type:complete
MVKKSISKRKGKRIYTKRKRGGAKKTCNQNHIVKTFLEMLNVIKLYHWKTHSFPEHKNTDELHEQLQSHVDKFVEVYLGKDGTRLGKWDKQMEARQYENTKDFKTRMYFYRTFIIELKQCYKKTKDSDLSNILDEILADVNQFLYLLTFK